MTTFTKVAMLTVSVLLVALMLIPSSAHAVLIVEESFDFGGGGDYTASPAGRNVVPGGSDGRTRGSSGAAQNPSTPIGFDGGAAGGAGSWQGAVTSLWQVQDTGLSFAGQPSSGGSVQYDWSSSGLTRMQDRALSSPPTVTSGDEYWMSGMVQYNALETDNEGAAYVGFGDTSTGTNATGDAGVAFFAENPKGLRIGLEATGSGGTMDLVLRHQNTVGVVTSDILSASIPAATPQLLFIKAEVDAVAGDDKISVWVNPASFGTDAELGAADFTFLDSSFDSASALDLFLLQGYEIDNAPGTGGVLFDEFRLGTTFFDVAPNAVPHVPEPSSLLLLGLGALGLVRHTRNRRRKV